jgi:hypothetical protein
VLGQQRLRDLERLVAAPLGRLLVEQLHPRVLLQRLLQAGEALLGRDVVENALQRDDAAAAAHGVEERVRGLVTADPPVEGDVRDPAVADVRG